MIAKVLFGSQNKKIINLHGRNVVLKKMFAKYFRSIIKIFNKIISHQDRLWRAMATLKKIYVICFGNKIEEKLKIENQFLEYLRETRIGKKGIFF